MSGRTADFFAVQYAVYAEMGGFLSRKKAFQRGIGTLEVIQPPGGDKLLRSSPYACLLAVVEKKIMAEDIAFISVS